MHDDKTIILIGPMSTGKSTIAERLADKLGLPRYAMDEHRWDYYSEIGYDEDEARRRREAGGVGAILKYWKPFEAHAVERVLATQSGCVIDFGAGHSVYEEPELFARVQKALESFSHVVLLLPSPDLDESVKITNTRFLALVKAEGVEVAPDMLEINAHFTKHPSNARLAKHTIYTKGKTPEQTCTEVIEKLGLKT